jgi:plasmid stabilization system protein ParE
MPAYRLTSTALDDLDEIWAYIARDNADAADRVHETILKTCESLARFPLQGAERRDLTSLPLRFQTVSRYPNHIVAYRPDVRPVEVVRILHGMRDFPRLL